MTESLPYLKLIYGNTVESYFLAGVVTMKSRQRWDKNKGGVIGEDDDFIFSMTAEESWWDDDGEEENGATNRLFGNAGTTSNIKVDAKNMISKDIPDVDNIATLSSLQTDADKMEEDGDTTVHVMLNVPPLIHRTIVNNESTILSNITMYTRMDAVESNMITTNASIGNLNNSVNYMSCILAKFMKEMKQSTNATASMSTNADESKLTHKNDSTTAIEDIILGNQSK